MQCGSVPDGSLCDLEAGIITVQCDGIRGVSLYFNGIRTGILPKENEKDLDEIDPNVRAKLRFVPVETVDAVFAEALVYPEAAPAARLDTVLPGAAEGGKLPTLRV